MAMQLPDYSDNHREGIPADEAKTKAQKYEPMSPDHKVVFRVERESWANDGCLPEGPNSEEIAQIEMDVRAKIEEQLRLKINLLDAKLRFEKIDPREIRDLLETVTSLKQDGLINDQIYQEAIEVIKPALSRGPHVGFDCDID